jgi:hypothetical protein
MPPQFAGGAPLDRPRVDQGFYGNAIPVEWLGMLKNSFTIQDLLMATAGVAVAVSLWLVWPGDAPFHFSWTRILLGIAGLFFLSFGLGALTTTRPVAFGLLMTGVFFALCAILGIGSLALVWVAGL